MKRKRAVAFQGVVAPLPTLSSCRTWFRLSIAAALLGASSAALAAGSFRKTDTGIIVTPERGPEKEVRLQVYGDSIIRVTASPTSNVDVPPSYMVTAAPQARAFAVTEANGAVTLATGRCGSRSASAP